jgi:hypothetical protein
MKTAAAILALAALVALANQLPEPSAQQLAKPAVEDQDGF